MIPDSLPLFNCPIVPKHFDDTETRLRCLLQQDAVPTLAGGRHLLYVCPVCQRPFYVAGRRAYPRLTDEQLSHLGSTFHADMHALHLLPRSLCPICSAIYLGGLFTIEAYRQDASRHCQGYHLLWESASFPYTMLVAMVYRPLHTSLYTLLSLEPDTLVTPVQEVCALLSWLEMRPCPATARVYSDEERHLLARRLPPASGLSRHDEAGNRASGAAMRGGRGPRSRVGERCWCRWRLPSHRWHRLRYPLSCKRGVCWHGPCVPCGERRWSRDDDSFTYDPAGESDPAAFPGRSERWVTSGLRLRATCPVHGGDHQRSLSIDMESGWGYCHCCHATVLVEQLDRNSSGERHASRSFVRERPGHDSTTPGKEYSYSHGLSCSLSVPPTWQQEERAALTTLAPLLRSSLLTSLRVQTYLEERGIPVALAQGSGMGYLSRAVWEQAGASLAAEQHTRLRRWIGRLLFLLHAPDGCGFIGRTLVAWQPGMDENAHKVTLEQPGMPRRWIKTNPAGWFGFADPARLADTLILVEGGFDRLALLAASIPATSVIALVGTAARPTWLVQHASQVKRIVLALDADEGGTAAMERLTQEFARTGIATICCPPSNARWGKDWNERWRRLGPGSVYPLFEVLAPCPAPRVSLTQPHDALPHDSTKGGHEQ